MESDKISQCRFCGIHTELMIDEKDHGCGGYFASCRCCGTKGPLVSSRLKAIEAWQEMMAPRALDPIMAFDKDGNVRMLESERSYRDRVDMMAAALISGIHTIMAEKDIAAWAIKQVDAIDKALAEREVPQVSKGDNT